MELREFMTKLASAEPVPGGGGASALLGGVGVALCSMVANLTTGKKKYAEYQADIDLVLARTDRSLDNMLVLIQKDADVFAPLAQAYGIPKDDPNREAVLESALVAACAVPLEILQAVADIADVLSILAQKGSRLAVSDVGVAAAALQAAAQGAALNVAINTKLMKNRDHAKRQDKKTQELLAAVIPVCQDIYNTVKKGLET